MIIPNVPVLAPPFRQTAGTMFSRYLSLFIPIAPVSVLLFLPLDSINTVNSMHDYSNCAGIGTTVSTGYRYRLHHIFSLFIPIVPASVLLFLPATGTVFIIHFTCSLHPMLSCFVQYYLCHCYSRGVAAYSPIYFKYYLGSP